MPEPVAAIRHGVIPHVVGGYTAISYGPAALQALLDHQVVRSWHFSFLLMNVMTGANGLQVALLFSLKLKQKPADRSAGSDIRLCSLGLVREHGQ